jgi:hypothetical protein
MMKKKTEEVSVNKALLNLVTPIGLEFTRSGIRVGESAAKVYAIIKYAGKPSLEWLSEITNLPGTVVSISFSPIEAGILIEALKSSIAASGRKKETTRDVLLKQRAITAEKDAESLLRRIDQDGEAVGLLSILIMPLAAEDADFKKICKRVESKVASLNCKARNLGGMQINGLKQVSPSYTLDPEVLDVAERVVPLSTFIGGFPFASAGFSDGSGTYFARDKAGGLVIINFWLRGGDRTNSNWIFTGVPGVGKSTAIKHIIVSEYMSGTKVIIIDPESEYRDLTRNLGGSHINAAGGRGGIINPFHVRPVPRAEDDDEDAESEALYVDDGQGMGDLAMHLKTLEIFFKLYLPSLDDMAIAVLKKSLIEVYSKFGITWETDARSLKNTDFPIASDIYAHLQQQAEAKGEDAKVYKDLSLLLYDMAHGADSFIFCGHTSVNLEARCLCFDTLELQNMTDNVKRAQYFNLLSLGWDLMSRDRTEKIFLVADEAYLMVDPQVPQSLVFLRNCEKRARKYEAALAVVLHSVVDVLAPEVKMHGQALLDLPCYKILMGTDGKNLQETADLYSLTEAEIELLEAKKRGHALFMAGNKRLHVNFDRNIPAYKLDLMGRGGGR